MGFSACFQVKLTHVTPPAVKYQHLVYSRIYLELTTIYWILYASNSVKELLKKCRVRIEKVNSQLN